MSAAAVPDLLRYEVKYVARATEKVSQRATTFLARSETLLMGFTHETDVRDISLEAPRRLSLLLLAESDTLRQSMTSIDQIQLGRLVTDLQAVLRQIANLEADQDALGLDLIQTGMSYGDLLFRINVEQIKSARNLVKQSPHPRQL